MNKQRREEIAAMTVATEPGELVAALEEAMGEVEMLEAERDQLWELVHHPDLAICRGGCPLWWNHHGCCQDCHIEVELLPDGTVSSQAPCSICGEKGYHDGGVCEECEETP